MEYLVTLIKDKGKYYRKGQVIGPVNIEGDNQLYNDGYIEDTYNIIKKETKKPKKKDNIKKDNIDDNLNNN